MQGLRIFDSSFRSIYYWLLNLATILRYWKWQFFIKSIILKLNQHMHISNEINIYHTDMTYTITITWVVHAALNLVYLRFLYTFTSIFCRLLPVESTICHKQRLGCFGVHIMCQVHPEGQTYHKHQRYHFSLRSHTYLPCFIPEKLPSLVTVIIFLIRK